MEDHGTAFPSWYITFQQAALAALPRPPKIDQDTALDWADNGAALQRAFLQALVPPVTVIEPVTVPKPALFDQFGTVVISATPDRFVVRDKFVLNYGPEAKPGVLISYIGRNFMEWFGDLIEPPAPETVLRYARLTRAERDDAIRVEIGAEYEKTLLSCVYALMERQPSGKKKEDGHSLIDWNAFYAVDAHGLLRAVGVAWGGVGWLVDAHSVARPVRWGKGGRFFSRNCCISPA